MAFKSDKQRKGFFGSRGFVKSQLQPLIKEKRGKSNFKRKIAEARKEAESILRKAKKRAIELKRKK